MHRFENIYRDIRYACRSLGRRPGFASVAVLTLAVGIGTMTVAFSAVNAFFLAGPPIDSAGAGTIEVTDGAPESSGASFREFETFVREVPALDVSAQSIVTLSRRRGDAAAIAWGLAVTDNYFDTLGVNAALGRTFGGVNDLSAVVSHRFWREELAGAGVSLILYPLSAFRAMNAAALKVYEAVRRDGTQKDVLELMQTRNDLYQYLDYHAYEQKLDALFAKEKK